MSLYQRPGSPYWQYDFTLDGQRFRGSTGKTGKREARQVEDELKHSSRRRPAKTWTINTLCEAYWDERAKDLKSAKTIFNQLVAIRRHIGKNRKLSTITNETMLEYRAKRRGDGLAQSSVNRELALLRAAMRYVNDMHDIAIPKLQWAHLMANEPPGRSRFLTYEEFGELLDAAHQSIRPILICAVTTGLRKANILTLDWQQVRLSARRISVVAKRDKVHEVRIVPMLAEALLAMPKRKGRVFDTTNFEKRWRAALKKTRIEDFHFHDLRHTFASWARQNGSDIADVKESLGHSDIGMTMRYAHIKPDAENTAFDRVSEVLSSHFASQLLQKREN